MTLTTPPPDAPADHMSSMIDRLAKDGPSQKYDIRLEVSEATPDSSPPVEPSASESGFPIGRDPLGLPLVELSPGEANRVPRTGDHVHLSPTGAPTSPAQPYVMQHHTGSITPSLTPHGGASRSSATGSPGTSPYRSLSPDAGASMTPPHTTAYSSVTSRRSFAPAGVPDFKDIPNPYSESALASAAAQASAEISPGQAASQLLKEVMRTTQPEESPSPSGLRAFTSHLGGILGLLSVPTAAFLGAAIATVIPGTFSNIILKSIAQLGRYLPTLSMFTPRSPLAISGTKSVTGMRVGFTALLGYLLYRRTSRLLRIQSELQSRISTQIAAARAFEALFKDSPIWLGVCDIEEYILLGSDAYLSVEEGRGLKVVDPNIRSPVLRKELDENERRFRLFGPNPVDDELEDDGVEGDIALAADRLADAKTGDPYRLHDVRFTAISKPFVTRRNLPYPPLEENTWFVRDMRRDPYRTDRFARAVLNAQTKRGFHEFKMSLSVVLLGEDSAPAGTPSSEPSSPYFIPANTRRMAYTCKYLGRSVGKDGKGGAARFFVMMQDVTEDWQTLKALQASEGRLKQFLEATSDGIWEMDIPTGTMHFSGRLATMLGYHPTELEGDLATWDNMVHPAYISRAQALRAAHLSGKSAFYEIEKQIRTKGGEWRWIFNRGKITVRDEKGNPVKMVGAHTDITDRKRAEIALEEKNRQLDLALQQSYQAAQAKTEFLANISHEIRTPLNGIIGLSSVLAETPLSPDQKDLLSSIQECSDGLLMVVNDVLDFSKIEAGKMSLEYNPFNLENCIRSTIYPLQLKAEEKAIEMRIEIEPDTPEWIVGDVFRTRQILNNLIGNAIKFTSQGSVTVHVSAALLPLASETASNALPRPETPTSTEKFADPSTALVSVSTMKPGSSRYRLQFDIIDTGIGIPADKIDRLFKSFSQVDASTSRRFGGTGLGLAICKQLVGMMDPKGGRMWVCSEEGRGSTFSFCYDVDGCDPPNGGDSKNVNGASDDEQHVNGKLRSRNAGSGEYRLSKSPSKVGRVANRLGNHKGHSDQRLVPKTKEKEVLADKIPLTILVAEDNAINQKLALRLLTQLGYTPSLANNGREAVDAVVNHAKAVSGTFDASNSQGAHAPSGTVATNACKPFDLILMDIQMPLMSGIEATAEIRSLPSSLLPEQPIILALTANALTSDKEICLKAGMDGHISKPVRAGDLRAEIERVMSLKRKIELDTDGSSASSGDDVSGASDGPVKEVRIQLHEPGERVRGAVTGIDFSPVPLTGENVVPAKPAYAPESRSRVPFEVEGLATKGAGALESMRVTNESVTPIASVEPPPIPTPDEAVTIPRQATPPTIEVSMGSSDSHDSSIPTTLPDQATSSISADTTNVTSVDSIIHRAWENERLEVDDKGRLSIGTTMATVNDSERKG